MINEKMPERLDLQFKDPNEFQSNQTQSAASPQDHHPEVGSSSLYGRVGNNITYHAQGAYKEGFFSMLWHWAWKDLGGAIFGLLRVFLPTRHK